MEGYGFEVKPTFKVDCGDDISAKLSAILKGTITRVDEDVGHDHTRKSKGRIYQ